MLEVVQQKNLENGREKEEEGEEEEEKYIPLAQVDVSFLDRHSTEVGDHSQRKHIPQGITSAVCRVG